MQRDRRFKEQTGSMCAGGLVRVGAGVPGKTGDCSVNGSATGTRFEDIDGMLREGYARGGQAKTQAIDAILREYPEVTRPMLWKRAQQLELAQCPPTFRKWNPAETRLLMDLVSEVPASVIAMRLRRPLKSVLGKARSLAMSSRLAIGLSIRQAAVDLQVSHHTVQALIASGVLAMEAGRISEKSYRKYCQTLHPVTRQEAVPASVVADMVSDETREATYEAVLNRTVVHILASGGLSLREAAALVLSDIHWIDGGCARLQVHRGKLDAERLVILSNSAGRALRMYRARRPDTAATDRLLVDESGRTLTAQAVESALLDFGRSRGSPVRISARGLRHAFAFGFLDRKCRVGSNDAFAVLPKLSELLGHYSPDTVLMYVGVLHPKTGGRQRKPQTGVEEQD